jgi:hypothetical protein
MLCDAIVLVEREWIASSNSLGKPRGIGSGDFSYKLTAVAAIPKNKKTWILKRCLGIFAALALRQETLEKKRSQYH